MTRTRNKFGVILALGIAAIFSAGGAHGQQIPRIGLKSGESAEVLNIFDIVNCRSVATASPEVEVLEARRRSASPLKSSRSFPVLITAQILCRAAR
jgi:hypothetical protein